MNELLKYSMPYMYVQYDIHHIYLIKNIIYYWPTKTFFTCAQINLHKGTEVAFSRNIGLKV